MSERFNGMQKRPSMFFRLFRYFITPSLLIIILGAIFYYQYALQKTEQRANEQLSNSLRESVALFKIGYQSPIESNLRILESAPSLNNFLSFAKDQAMLVRYDIEKQFSQLIRSRPQFYRSIRYIDASGMERVVVEGRKRQRDYRSVMTEYQDHERYERLQETFQWLKKNRPKQLFFSQPYLNPEGKYLFYAAISKLEPEIGGFGGGIVIECDLSFYIESLTRIRTQGYPSAWLLTPDGKVISKPDDSFPQHDPRIAANGYAIQQKSGIVRLDLYPGSILDEQLFLSVVLSLPEEIFHKQSQNILKTTVLIALIAITFTLLLAWVVARNITAPVTELVKASQHIAVGDYTTRCHLTDKSEIGELANAFNHMAETLELGIQRLNNELLQRRNAELASQRSNESLQLILNSTAEGIFGIDTAGRFTFCNLSALKLLGYQQETDLVGRKMHLLIQPKKMDGSDYLTEDSQILKSITTESTIKCENEIFWRADRSSFPVAFNTNPFKRDGSISGVVVSFSDITERKKQEQKIIYQAHHDMLTGLPNRFLAMDRLERLLKTTARHNRMAAVLFIDLDGFKKVNDLMGHEMGDKLLLQSAQRLKNCLRDDDTVGRLGGDEFIVLLGELNRQHDAGRVAATILEAFRHPFQIGGHELMLTASIGIAVFPDDSEQLTELLRLADIAMYESKQSGRNTYQFFTSELNTGILRRLEVEEQLNHALTKSEFYLTYQPIVDIQSMDITGVEVLLRWNNDKLGLVSPDEFIPIAEQTGLINEIGDYVLCESMAQIALWQKQFQRQLKLSVNVSPRQFHSNGLYQEIIALLDKYQLKGEGLQIEITEGVLMNRNQAVEETLQLMHAAGIKVAMDDFGTGYSSLSYLRNYPFDSLKVDRTFVSDLQHEQSDRALVNATVQMSHALGIKVVAEGIETNEQLQILIKEGCDFGQGYLFSKPVIAEEFESILVQCQSLHSKVS